MEEKNDDNLDRAWNVIYDVMVKEHYWRDDKPFRYNKVADRIIILLKKEGLLDV